MTKEDIITLLDNRKIEYSLVQHKAVFTIDEMNEVDIPHKERIAKNLFLRDDKKRIYYLVSIEEDKKADLKVLRTLLSSRPLSFASEEDLESILSLRKGEVTPFGLLNDNEHRAVFILDSYFSGGIIGIHPNDNSATVFLETKELLSIFEESKIEAHIVDIPCII